MPVNGKKRCKDEREMLQDDVSHGLSEEGGRGLKIKWQRLISWDYGIYSAIFVIFFYSFVLPGFYTRDFKFPNASEIHHSDGIFNYKVGSRKSHVFPAVEKNGHQEFFTCASIYGVSSTCGMGWDVYKKFRAKGKDSQEEIFKSWQGKKSSIAWFYQRIHLFTVQRRVVEIVVDGEIVLSKDKVRASITRAKGDWLYDVIYGFSFMLLTAFIVRISVLRKVSKRIGAP